MEYENVGPHIGSSTGMGLSKYPTSPTAFVGAPKKEKSIGLELSALVESVSMVDSLCRELSSKLMPVLSPEINELPVDGPSRDVHPVGLTNEIMQQRNRLGRLASHLRDTISRVEL